LYGVLGATYSESVSVTILPSTHSTLSGASEDTPVTAVQHFLQATSLSDDSLRSEESLTEDIELPTPPPSSTIPSSVESGQLWKDIDQAEANDPLFSAEYTPEIFRYMREREVSNPCVSMLCDNNFVQQHWLGTIKDTLYCLALQYKLVMAETYNVLAITPTTHTYTGVFLC